MTIAHAETLADYQRDYRNGWNASERYGTSTASNSVNAFETPLDRADARGASHAWYDGYHDNAAGRDRWHLLNCQGCDEHDDRISPATRIARAERGEQLDKIAPVAMTEQDAHRVGAHDDLRSASCPDCPAPGVVSYAAAFTDAERAELERITTDLHAAIAAARDALDRLPWASAADQHAAVSQIAATIPAHDPEPYQRLDEFIGVDNPNADNGYRPYFVRIGGREFRFSYRVAARDFLLTSPDAASYPAEPTLDADVRTVEPDDGRYHRAVRIGDTTIGYIAARGRQAWIAWDEHMLQIETSGDAHQGMWYTADAAIAAVEDAYRAKGA